MTGPIKRRTGRRLRRQRGIVMLEGMIVATVLVIFVASGLFLHAVYAQKISVTGKARVSAWTRALNGCGGMLDYVSASSTMLRGGGSSSLQVFATERARDVSTSTVIASTAAPKQLGGDTFEQRSLVSVACNETPQGPNEGDLEMLAAYLSENLLPALPAASSLFF